MGWGWGGGHGVLVCVNEGLIVEVRVQGGVEWVAGGATGLQSCALAGECSGVAACLGNVQRMLVACQAGLQQSYRRPWHEAAGAVH